MKRRVASNREVQAKTTSAADKLLQTVGSTLGPAGRRVLVQVYNGHPVVTKDGVSVAAALWLEDPIENDAAQIIVQSARKLGKEAGDGTTTATIITCALLKEALTAISKKPMFGRNTVNPNLVCEHLTKMALEAESLIDAMKMPFGDEDVQRIAMISSNNDTTVCDMVSKAIGIVGTGGYVIIEQSRDGRDEVVERSGYNYSGIGKGLFLPAFINDPKRMAFKCEEACVLVVNEELNAIEPWKEFFTGYMRGQRSTKPLLIIANDFKGAFLQTIITNVQKNALQCVLVKSPSYGEQRRQMMRDLCLYTGADYICNTDGIAIAQARETHLGKVSNAVIGQNEVTLMRHEDVSVEGVNKALELLHDAIKNAQGASHIVQAAEDRLKALVGSAAIIYVGGQTESEMKERLDRVDDAYRAVVTASKDGIVVGGGRCLQYVSQSFENRAAHSQEEAVACKAIVEALKAPMRFIIENGGRDAERVIEELQVHSSAYGYNAQTHALENMFSAGILDPSYIEKMAVKTAVSCACTLISVGVGIPFVNGTGEVER